MAPTIINSDTRFILWDQPQPPFFDAINNDVRGPVFDLGIELEYYTGPIYLRADHVADMAKALGFIEGSVHNELKEKYQSLVDYTDSLMEVEILADRLRDSLGVPRPDLSEPLGDSVSGSEEGEGDGEDADSESGVADDFFGIAKTAKR